MRNEEESRKRERKNEMIKMTYRISGQGISFLLFLLLLSSSPATAARLTLKSICRIKGQEENTIQGLGVVVGLKGTGDSASYLPTIRSVGKIMSIMGNPPGSNGLADLKDTKNVALVTVTCT